MLLRTTKMWENDGADWEKVRATKPTVYTPDDLAGETNAYYVFKLPAQAAPYIRLAVKKEYVTITET